MLLVLQDRGLSRTCLVLQDRGGDEDMPGCVRRAGAGRWTFHTSQLCTAHIFWTQWALRGDEVYHGEDHKDPAAGQHGHVSLSLNFTSAWSRGSVSELYMVELQFLKSHFLFEDPNSLSYLELMFKHSHSTVTLRQFGQLCLSHITFPQLISGQKITRWF